MKRSRPPHIHRPDDDKSDGQQYEPGFAWNSTTQEFIEILPQGHPGYRQNAEIVAAAIRRWNAGTSKK